MRSAAVLFTLLLAASVAGAADPPAIAVGDVKVFDVRVLDQMLRSAEKRLEQASFVDTAQVAGSIGAFSGATSETSAFGVQLTTTPTPSIENTRGEKRSDEITSGSSLKTQNATAPAGPSSSVENSSNSGQKGTTSSEASQTVKEQSVSGQVPAFPAVPSSLTIPQLRYGLAARDVLGEQVALTYEVANLRLLLDRALTDRLTPSLAGQGIEIDHERRLVLLGFQVSIDPRRQHRDAAAEVSITFGESAALPPGAVDIKRMSVVSLFPSKNTYNVAAITKDVRSVGVGAVVSAFNVGVSAQKTNETFYLVRDVDTVALERPDGTQAGTFGWIFRPVLGRRIVEPGLRQVFALVALPAGFAGDEVPYVVKTRWRGFDKRSGSLGGVFDDRGSRSGRAWIPKDELVRRSLAAKILGVSWADGGDGRATVTVTGARFGPGTHVLVGGRPLTETAGLFVRDDVVRFNAPAAALLYSDVHSMLLVGTDGADQAIEYPWVGAPAASTAPSVARCVGPLRVTSVSTRRLDRDRSRVTLGVLGLHPNDKALVGVGTTVYGLADRPLADVGLSACGCVETIDVVVPTGDLITDSSIRIAVPFGGPTRTAVAAIPSSRVFALGSVTVAAKDETNSQLLISGNGFDSTVTVQSGKTIYQAADASHPLHVRPTLLALSVPTADLPKALLIEQSNQAPALVSMTPPAAKLPKPVVMSPDPSIGREESGDIELKGANFLGIDAVLLEGKTLSSHANEDGSGLVVRLQKEDTDRGTAQLDYVLKDGQAGKLARVVIR